MPAGWKEVPTTQAMRLATFDADGVEISLSAFPGTVGGDLANVNRWRGQIGLAAIAEGELEKTVSRRRSGATELATMSMTGADGQVMLAAIVTPGDGQTWFVKSITDATRAAQLMSDFEMFAASIRRASAGGAAGTGASASTASSAAAPAMVPSDTDSIDGRLAGFKPPPHWSTESQSGGIVAAAYSAQNAVGGARITATSLANDGGGDLANINRWRGQLGLAPAESLASVERVDLGTGGIAVDLADAKGTDRMIAVIHAAGGETWFFKLRGPVDGVEAERGEFATFVRAVTGGDAR